MLSDHHPSQSNLRHSASRTTPDPESHSCPKPSELPVEVPFYLLNCPHPGCRCWSIANLARLPGMFLRQGKSRRYSACRFSERCPSSLCKHGVCSHRENSIGTQLGLSDLI